MQNPAVGREKAFGNIKHVQSPEKVVIVGGGPAGLTTAKYLSLKGHKVVLLEKRGRLGGQLNNIAKIPEKQDFYSVISCLEKGLLKTEVEVRLNTEARPDLIFKEKPGLVVNATGSLPKEMAEIDNSVLNVISAYDLLHNKGAASLGENVVVLGGGLVGCEVAYYLAVKGKQVVILEQKNELAKDEAEVYKEFLLKRLKEYNVNSKLQATVTGVEDNCLLIRDIATDDVLKIDASGGVVLALGANPSTALAMVLKDVSCNVVCVGDSCEPGKLIDAIEDGVKLGLTLKKE